MAHEEIVAELTSMGSIAVEALDEAVCDAKSNEAASLNNQGIEEQVRYLGDESAQALLKSLRNEKRVLRGGDSGVTCAECGKPVRDQGVSSPNGTVHDYCLRDNDGMDHS